MIAELERRTREEMYDGATHLDYAESWVASGRSILQLANEISAATKLDIFREALRRYLYELDPGKAQERLDRARAQCAYGLIESANTIADGAKEESIGVARLQVQTRQWTAERYNRDAFGTPKGPNISISIHGLHLDALRARTVSEQDAIPAAIAQADELATVVSIEP